MHTVIMRMFLKSVRRLYMCMHFKIGFRLF